MEQGVIILPRYELLEASLNLRQLLRAVIEGNCDVERVRGVLEWDNLWPGEGPPSRTLLLELANYLGYGEGVNANISKHALVMSALNNLTSRMLL